MKIFKVILIGDPRVGKTSIRKQYMGEGFNTNYLVTIGADFSIKRMKKGVIQIWDLAGQDAYRSFRRNYFRGAHGALFLFDLLEEKSLINMETWLQEVADQLGKMIPTIIIGNKVDQINEDTTGIGKEQIDKAIRRISNNYQQEFPYLTTSAVTGENVEYAFDKLLEIITK